MNFICSPFKKFRIIMWKKNILVHIHLFFFSFFFKFSSKLYIIQLQFLKSWNSVQNVHKNIMQLIANLINPYFIHRRTRKTYQMLKVRHFTISQKNAHFECDGVVSHEQKYPGKRSGERRNICRNKLQLIIIQ